MQSFTTLQICKWLLDEHILLPDQHATLLRRVGGVDTKINPLIRLAQLQVTSAKNIVLTLEFLTDFVARHMNVDYFRIDPLKVDVASITSVMSVAFAKHHHILPVEVTSQYIKIAVGGLQNESWIDSLTSQVKVPIKIVLSNPQDIERYITEFFNVSKSIKNSQKPAMPGSGLSSFEQLVEISSSDKALEANDQGVVKLVDWLWQYAFEQRASDIHLEPRRDIGAIRFRIDGVLHTVYQAPLQILGAMTARIKSLGRMDVIEKRRPQDGRIKTRGQFGEIEMRLSTLPTAFGEKMVMRIFDPLVAVKSLAQLGFSNEHAKQWELITKRPHGIILVTGPTGSGKTTTLYSTLKRLATDAVNVNTIEDPIEMIEPSFNQTQVQPALDFNFAEGLRALMRQDPDIIMVGEIRDLATAEMAIQASLTGHLVFSTMHTNDAPSAISRLIELGVPAYLISATVTAVLAQRLVRTLCVECKQEDTEVNIPMVTKLFEPWAMPSSYKVYKPVGCATCRNTGFKGRAGVYELLSISEAFKDQIHTNPQMSALRKQAIVDHMQPLRLAGMHLYLAGVTTLEEIIDATPELISSRS